MNTEDTVDLAIAFMDEGEMKKIIAWLDARAKAYEERGRKFAAIIIRDLMRDLFETLE